VIIELGDKIAKNDDFQQVVVEYSTAYELFGRIVVG